MNSLDEKLKELILGEVYDAGSYDVEGIDPESVDNVIPLIKKCFADEGYIHLPNLKPGDYIITNGGEVRLNGDGTMTKVKRFTGQEWYDRLENELGKWNVKDNVRSLNGFMVKELAKKAAGIKS